MCLIYDQFVTIKFYNPFEKNLIVCQLDSNEKGYDELMVNASITFLDKNQINPKIRQWDDQEVGRKIYLQISDLKNVSTLWRI